MLLNEHGRHHKKVREPLLVADGDALQLLWKHARSEGDILSESTDVVVLFFKNPSMRDTAELNLVGEKIRPITKEGYHHQQGTVFDFLDDFVAQHKEAEVLVIRKESLSDAVLEKMGYQRIEAEIFDEHGSLLTPEECGKQIAAQIKTLWYHNINTSAAKGRNTLL